jgi:cyanophycinase-like exopeptidase
MQRLLQRGGVIAGASAGCAMMGDACCSPAAARGARHRAGAAYDDGEPVPLGPQLGPGMKFLPWAITDSHFFERDRIGRLVAGLETNGRRLGIGVGEDAAVEVDLATGRLTGVSVGDSLLVDAARCGARNGPGADCARS